MSTALAGWLQVLLLIAALAACYVPLGNYIAHIFTSEKHWRVEAGIYKIIGVNPEADQKWSAYLRSMLAFSRSACCSCTASSGSSTTCCCRWAWPTCRPRWPSTPPPRS